LIREKARERLAEQMLKARLSRLGLKVEAPQGQTALASYRARGSASA
jgi:hypothetical protein